MIVIVRLSTGAYLTRRGRLCFLGLGILPRCLPEQFLLQVKRSWSCPCMTINKLPSLEPQPLWRGFFEPISAFKENAIGALPHLKACCHPSYVNMLTQSRGGYSGRAARGSTFRKATCGPLRLRRCIRSRLPTRAFSLEIQPSTVRKCRSQMFGGIHCTNA